MQSHGKTLLLLIPFLCAAMLLPCIAAETDSAASPPEPSQVQPVPAMTVAGEAGARTAPSWLVGEHLLAKPTLPDVQLTPGGAADLTGVETPDQRGPKERPKSKGSWELGAAKQTGKKFRTDQILVKPKKEAKHSDVAALHASLKSKVKKEFPEVGNLQVVEIPKGADVLDYVGKYKKSKDVQYAEPDYTLRAYHTCETETIPNEDMWPEMWGLQNTGQLDWYGVPGTVDADIDAPCTWTIRHDATMPSGQDVVVAVIDTGICYEHSDLVDNLWVNEDEEVGDANSDGYPGVAGVDDDSDGKIDEDSAGRQPGEPGYTNDLKDDDDENSYVDDIHGMNAIENYIDIFGNPQGPGDPKDDVGHGTHVSGTIGAVGNNEDTSVGVAWKVDIMACKFLGRNGEGDTSDAIEAMVYARKNGAQIMSNSWGGTEYSESLRDAIAEVRDDGIFFIAAAGNSTMDNDLNPHYPSSYDVDGSGDLLDNLISVAATNRQDNLANFSCVGTGSVDIAAPGVDILSTFVDDVGWPMYEWLSGTSMATPHVSGALAILKAQYPTESNARLIGRLFNSADKPDGLQGKCRTNGRLNLYRAMTESPPDMIVTPESAFRFGGEPGGPYYPASRMFIVMNCSNSSLDWTATTGQNSWVTLTPSSGTLAAGASVAVIATINSNADSLGAGVHTQAITFTNQSGTGSCNRAVSLGLGKIHVKTDGDDGNDGSSWTLAKESLGGALAAAHPRQEIWVAAGKYVDHVVVTGDNPIYGGFAGTETSLSQRPAFPRAYPDANETVIDGQWDDDYYQVFMLSCGHNPYTRVDGFTVTRSVGYAGIFARESSPTIANNTVTQSYGGLGAIGMYGPGEGTVTNNKCTGNGWAYGGVRCLYYSSPVIANNTFVAAGAIALEMEAWCDPVVVNNTFVGHEEAALMYWVCDPVFANNVMSDNLRGVYAVQYEGYESNPTFWNNNVISADENYVGVMDPTGTNGNISANPLFASTIYGNFHLQPNSPCREAGSNAHVQSGWKDMDGQNRVQGTYVDIGADETDGTQWNVTPIVVYVSPSGDDSNDGLSWPEAKRTIQAGVDLASAYGGEVWVAAGYYAGGIFLHPYLHLYGGFAGDETLRDQRDPAENRCIIDGEGAYEVVRTIGGYYIPWNGVDGFTLVKSGVGIMVYCASPVIANNTIKWIEGHGMWLEFGDTQVLNNTIKGNKGYAVVANRGNATIIGNTMMKNCYGISGGAWTSPVIANNILAYNQTGISVYTSTYNPEANCHPTLSHNCVYGNSFYAYSGTNPGSGDIQQNPKLVSADFGRTHIQPDSPCMNAGDDSYVPSGSRDMDWEARIQSSHVDIGADESDGTTWPTSPTVVRVKPDGSDANDGSTWELAKATVQAGIGKLADDGGGEVWAKAGTYLERINIYPFTHVYGGFAGTETQKSQRNWTQNVTVLDGELEGSVATFKAGFKCATIDGFAVQNGKSTVGGGIRSDAASPTIANNIVKDSEAIPGPMDAYTPAGVGGGIYAAGGVVLTNNTVTSNTAEWRGGGMCLQGGIQTITGNTVTWNTVTSPEWDDGSGGGIFASSLLYGIAGFPWDDPYVSTTLTGNTITDNTADIQGGGIYQGYAPTLTYSGNTVARNRVTADDSAGGGIYMHCYAVYTRVKKVENNLIEDNQARSLGGGFFSTPGSYDLTIANNRFISNSTDATGLGGGVYIQYNSPKIVSNTFVGNEADDGGALYMIQQGTQFPVTPPVSNNIIVSNSSGIYKNEASSPVLRNNDVYGNTDYNYSPGLPPGQGDISEDPEFYGDDYHLAWDSPCINAGWDSAPGIRTTDMDGQPRLNAETDMGADEYLILRVATSGSDSYTGCDWDHPKQHIQSAIDSVTSGPADVWVKTGTYQQCLVTKDLIQLYGGFAGGEWYRNPRDLELNETVINTNGFGPIISVRSGESRATRIDGFTLTGGAALQGGGIYCSGSSPTITKNIISNNDCAWPVSYIGSGGGIYCTSGSPLIDTNRILKNGALFGGGIYLDSDSSPTIVNNVISGNWAWCDGFEGGYGGWGGGINCQGPAVITNNTITDNTRDNSIGGVGGGIYCTSSQATIENNVIAFNTDGVSVAQGVTPTLDHNDLYGNYWWNYHWGTTPGPNDIFVDPQLAYRAAGDFHLRDVSLCRDAGDNAAPGIPIRDFDAQARIEGVAVDIGADESYGEVYPTVALRVNDDSPNDGPGTDWDHAWRAIDSALNYATIGDEIWVAAGDYPSVCIKSDVSLYGGFAGTETARDQRDWNENISIVDGGGSWIPVLIEFVENTRVDGFTIQNGFMADPFNGGGGVYCSFASSVIANNVIKDNMATYPWGNGGGVYCEYATADIEANLITGNAAGIGGGGIFTMESTVDIENNVITGNDADAGGGIRTSGSGTVTITNNTISANTADTEAAGIDCNSSSPTVTNNIIAFNGSGIGKSGTGSSPVLSCNDVFGNTAYNYKPGLSPGTGDISLNPLFMNYAAGNLHLQGGSPCIDTGTNSGAPSTDKDGRPRPLDGDGNGQAVTDMGAYEHPLVLGSGIKLAPNGTSVALERVSVTACFLGADPSGQNWVYIETPDRTAGIRVKTPAGFSTGDLVDVEGTMQTDTATGERYIAATPDNPSPAGGTLVLDPLGMRNQWVGGDGSGYAPDIYEGFGFYNVGMLLTTWGTVEQTNTQGGYFYVDDGSNLWDGYGGGLRVYLPSGAQMPALYSYVKVTGISGAFSAYGYYMRTLKPRNSGDIQAVTAWDTGGIGLEAGRWNMLTVPGIPRWPYAYSVFVGCPGGPGIVLDGYLKRYEARTQQWVWEAPCADMPILLCEGYGLYIPPGGNTCYDYQRTPAPGDQLISLPVGSQNATNFSFVGEPFTSSIAWSSLLATDGRWIMPLPDAVGAGLVHKVQYYDGAAGTWNDVTNLSTGSMLTEKGYLIYPRDNNVAVYVPAP